MDLLTLDRADLIQRINAARRQFRLNLRSAAKGCTLDRDARRFQHHLLQTQRYSLRLLHRQLRET